jgi:hypothetical protein
VPFPRHVLVRGTFSQDPVCCATDLPDVAFAPHADPPIPDRLHCNAKIALTKNRTTTRSTSARNAASGRSPAADPDTRLPQTPIRACRHDAGRPEGHEGAERSSPARPDNEDRPGSRVRPLVATSAEHAYPSPSTRHAADGGGA